MNPSAIEAARLRLQERIRDLNAAIEEWESFMANRADRPERVTPPKFVLSTQATIPSAFIKWMRRNPFDIVPLDWHCPRCGFDGKGPAK